MQSIEKRYNKWFWALHSVCYVVLFFMFKEGSKGLPDNVSELRNMVIDLHGKLEGVEQENEYLRDENEFIRQELHLLRLIIPESLCQAALYARRQD